jgi:hypothetical protein
MSEAFDKMAFGDLLFASITCPYGYRLTHAYNKDRMVIQLSTPMEDGNIALSSVMIDIPKEAKGSPSRPSLEFAESTQMRVNKAAEELRKRTCKFYLNESQKSS